MREVEVAGNQRGLKAYLMFEDLMGMSGGDGMWRGDGVHAYLAGEDMLRDDLMAEDMARCCCFLLSCDSSTLRAFFSFFSCCLRHSASWRRDIL